MLVVGVGYTSLDCTKQGVGLMFVVPALGVLPCIKLINVLLCTSATQLGGEASNPLACSEGVTTHQADRWSKDAKRALLHPRVLEYERLFS